METHDSAADTPVLAMECTTCTILHFPNELLLEIFQHYVKKHSLDALTLSHVRSRWRNASIGIGKLWSSIGVYSRENPNSVGVREMIGLYLER